MSAHTPGPWWVTDYGVRDTGGYICATIKANHYDGQHERYARETAEREASARLIAAAPELLEACKRWEAMIPLLRMLTVHQVLSAGDAAIDAAGLNPYCINEGLAAGDEPAIAEWKFESIRAAIAKANGATP